MKREQNYIARSLPKKPSGLKHIECYHCGAFGHLRPQYSKFHALKWIKRKEKLEFHGSYAKNGKPILSENSMLLEKVFNTLNSLTMCIYGSHSSNPRLTSHETLIPNNRSVWMKKGSYGWAFTLLVLDLILSIFVRPFMLFCILHFFVCIVLLSLILLLCFSFMWIKNPKPHKKWKFQKSLIVYVWAHITCEFGLVPSY